LAKEYLWAEFTLCSIAERYIVSFRHSISHSPLLLWSFSFVGWHSSETKKKIYLSGTGPSNYSFKGIIYKQQLTAQRNEMVTNKFGTKIK